MRGDRSWTHELILAAARRDVPARLFGGALEDQVHRALLVAAENGVAGWVARELRTLPALPMAVQIQLQAVTAKTVGNHRRRMEATAEVLGAFAEAEIPAMVVKGPALVERYYRDPGVRGYADVDMLVRPERLREAVGVLEGRGFSLLDANWPLIIMDFKGEIHLHKDRVQTIDLHWHLLNEVRKRHTLRVSMPEIWQRAERTTLAGAPGYVMDPSDELAYVCLHAAISGCHRFLWLLDMKVMAEHPGLEWERVADRLRRWRFGAAGYLALSLAKEWADAAVPLHALRSIRPGAGTRSEYRALVDRWDLADNSGARLRQLFFATAADDIATRVRLAYDAVVPSRGIYRAERGNGPLFDLRRVTVGTVQRVRHKLDNPDPQWSKEFEPVGDPVAGRERYLSLVERAATEA